MSDPSQPVILQPAASGAKPADLLRTGDALLARADYAQAMLQYMELLQQCPDVAEYHWRLGITCNHLGQTDAANFSIAEALRLNPDYAMAHGEMSRLLMGSGRIIQALEHARRAVELAPDDAELAVAFASLLYADRQNEAAWEIVDRLLSQGRRIKSLAVLYGRMAPGRKREAQAIEFTLGLLNSPDVRPRRDQSSLHSIAASLLDALGRYDEAFEQASRANALRDSKYDPARTERLTRDWMEYFTRPTLQRLPHAAHGSGAPVFIVGMPRSGTTLIEQILASHPAVHGGGELRWLFNIWPSALRRTPGAASLTQCLDRLSAKDVEELAAEYLTPLKGLKPEALRITDKLPGNYVNLGLIALLFPRAKIIHARRDALDTCLSCFMNDFEPTLDFSLSLASCGHVYRHYQKIMSHWKDALEVEILDVEYERVVEDVEAQARRMVEFLGLPWDQRCLDFYENKRFVATASHTQVRRPIYRGSVGRWRHYDKHLKPLRDAMNVK
jgi:tetratricopeptide (TPR) repeat protein